MSEQKCIFAESTEKSRALWKETARLFAKSPRLLPKKRLSMSAVADNMGRRRLTARDAPALTHSESSNYERSAQSLYFCPNPGRRAAPMVGGDAPPLRALCAGRTHHRPRCGMPFGTLTHGRHGQHRNGARRARFSHRCAQSPHALGLGLPLRHRKPHAGVGDGGHGMRGVDGE